MTNHAGRECTQLVAGVRTRGVGRAILRLRAGSEGSPAGSPLPALRVLDHCTSQLRALESARAQKARVAGI